AAHHCGESRPDRAPRSALARPAALPLWQLPARTGTASGRAAVTGIGTLAVPGWGWPHRGCRQIKSVEGSHNRLPIASHARLRAGPQMQPVDLSLVSATSARPHMQLVDIGVNLT